MEQCFGKRNDPAARERRDYERVAKRFVYVVAYEWSLTIRDE